MGASGCKSTTSSSDVAGTGDESASTDVAAQEADPSIVTDVGPTAATDPLPAPPAARVEVEGPAPSDHHVWMNGYWWWDAGQNGYAWSPGFWQDRNQEATTAPPAVIYEDPGRAPSVDYTYIPGYWNWRGAEYVWYHGYWGQHRDGFAYVHPYWEEVGGHWGSTGWGWERYDAGWEGRHAGLEFHGGVWERPADFHLRVNLALGHASDYRVAPGTWHGHVYGRADHRPGVAATVHPGERITERAPMAAARPRMGAPGEPRRAGAPERPAQQARPAEEKPGEREHKPEVERRPQAEPAEPARRPEAEQRTEVKRAPEQRTEVKREPEHRTEVKREPEHKR